MNSSGLPGSQKSPLLAMLGGGRVTLLGRPGEEHRQHRNMSCGHVNTACRHLQSNQKSSRADDDLSFEAVQGLSMAPLCVTCVALMGPFTLGNEELVCCRMIYMVCRLCETAPAPGRKLKRGVPNPSIHVRLLNSYQLDRNALSTRGVLSRLNTKPLETKPRACNTNGNGRLAALYSRLHADITKNKCTCIKIISINESTEGHAGFL